MRTEIVRLLPKHYKILELILSGVTISEIAGLLKIHRGTVSNIINSERFQDELARRREAQTRVIDDVVATEALTAHETLNKAATLAAETEVELLGGETPPNVRLHSAEAILDRVYPRDAGDGGRAPIVIDKAQVVVLISSLNESAEARKALALMETEKETKEPVHA